MYRVHFQQSACGGENPDPVSFTVEGRTPIQALAALELRLEQMFDPMDGGLLTDLGFDAAECLETIGLALGDAKPYDRRCFSTPEMNWSLTAEEVEAEPRTFDLNP